MWPHTSRAATKLMSERKESEAGACNAGERAISGAATNPWRDEEVDVRDGRQHAVIE